MKQSAVQQMGQRMAVTPQMLYSIRLMELSTHDLQHEINEALAANPLLESVESGSEEADDTSEAAERKAAQEAKEFLDQVALVDLDHAYAFDGPKGNASPDNDTSPIDFLVEPGSSDPTRIILETLQGRTRPSVLRAVEYWLGCVSDRGYLDLNGQRGLDGLEMAYENGLAAGHARSTLDTARELLLYGDFPGTTSLNLREHLICYIETLPNTKAALAAYRLLTDHIDLVTNQAREDMAEALGVESSTIDEALDLLREAPMCPFAGYHEEPATPITPDLIVWKEGDQWQVALNSKGMPRIRVNKAMASAPGELGNLVDQARWMIRGVSIRNATLINAGRAIISKQIRYLEHGPEFLAPLTLSDVSKITGLHESSISRITTNKWVMTPAGVIELKSLFGTRIEGTETSGPAVRHIVGKLIASEPANAPLSDTTIVSLLERRKIKVARRTVAKYREQLGIASARERAATNATKKGNAR